MKRYYRPPKTRMVNLEAENLLAAISGGRFIPKGTEGKANSIFHYERDKIQDAEEVEFD